MLTSQQVAAKWSRNTAGATDSLKAGVASVTTAPTATAAQRLDKYLSGTANAVNSGRMAAALNAVSLADWQNAMNTKAVARIGQGVQASVGKFQSFMDKWLPYEQTLRDRVRSMPNDGTLASSQARAAFAIAYNAAFSHRLIGS